MFVKSTKVLKNYLFKYLLGFGVVFVTNVVMLYVAKDTIESYIIKQVEIQVEDGIQGVDETIETMDFISQMMCQNSDFTKLIYSGDAFPKEQIVALKKSADLLANAKNVSNCTPYMFVLFEDNDIYLSNSQCSISYSKYYDEFLKVTISGRDITEPNEFKQLIIDNKRAKHNFLLLDSIQFISEGKEEVLKNVLLYLTDGNLHIPSQKYTFCFVVSSDYIVDTILGDNVNEQDYFMVLTDEQFNEKLLSYGDIAEVMSNTVGESGKGEEIYHKIACDSKYLKWQVEAGVSGRYIDKQMVSVQRLLSMYLCIGFIISVMMILLFSLTRYYGFRRVWRSFSSDERGTVNPLKFDEYKYISEHVVELEDERKDYRKQLDDLKYQNQAIMLENMITKGNYSEKEIQIFMDYFGKVPEYYCVVVVDFWQIQNNSIEMITVDMTEELESKNVLVAGNVYSGISGELFLIECLPNQNAGLTELLKIFEDVTMKICDEYNCILHIGISAIGTGINNINRCYEQAKRIVQSQYENENESVVRLYDITENSLYENPITVEFMSRLYSILISAQYENAERELLQIEGRYNRALYLYEMNKEQIFYSIRNVFHTVLLHLNNVEGEDILPKYDQAIKCRDMISEFLHSAEYICNYILHMKKSKNDGLKDKIKFYIQEHYQDAGLSAFIVSREVGIAEKYLYQYWKEQTGETFATYLLRIRIDKAKEYLENTDYNNERIATLTGFASSNTFYRNFQKIVGVTPKKYKENIALKKME